MRSLQVVMLTLWPNLIAACDWMRTWGDSNGDGLIDYARAAETGLANQGWKDSGDSVQWHDGRLARGRRAERPGALELGRRRGHVRNWPVVPLRRPSRSSSGRSFLRPRIFSSMFRSRIRCSWSPSWC